MATATRSTGQDVGEHQNRATRSVTEIVAAVFGTVFLAVGVLGFVPGITSNFDQLSFAGHHSGAELLGIFQVSILHKPWYHLSSASPGCSRPRPASERPGPS